jgi:Ca2+-binding RTX toxin-like protein
MASPVGNVIQLSSTPMADPANKVVPLTNWYCPEMTSSHRLLPNLPGPNRISTEGASVGGTVVSVGVGGTDVNVAVGGTRVDVLVGRAGVNVLEGGTGVNVLVGCDIEVDVGISSIVIKPHPLINSNAKNKMLT